MGWDGDGDGAVEEQGYSSSHLCLCFLRKGLNCCTFYIITFPVLCFMFLATSTMLIYMLFLLFFFS
jgi:hypothetical protein